MKNQGFTVIELLVVIAIIGLLASVVLVSLNLPERRKQATLAKSLQFSQSIQNALGAESAGWWMFETVESGKTSDMSGNGNAGVISGAVWVENGGMQLSAGGGTGSALSFDGADDNVSAGNGASLNITDAIAIEAWFYAKAWENPGGNCMRIVSKGQNEAYQLYICKNSGLCFTIGARYTPAACKKISLEQWYHVAGTYDGSVAKIYVNGQLSSDQETFNQAIPITADELFIGNWKTGSGERPFNGLIDDVRIYSQALTAGDIQRHYAEGLESRRDLAAE